MVLAAGRGTRLRPLTDRVPKCMVPIGGKPLLEHTIEWLRGFGVTEVIINLSHLPDVIRGHLGDGERWGVRITYSLEAEPLGTAGGVKRAAWFFDGPFFLWYGDNLSTCNLPRLYETHRAKGGRATISSRRRACRISAVTSFRPCWRPGSACMGIGCPGTRGSGGSTRRRTTSVSAAVVPDGRRSDLHE